MWSQRHASWIHGLSSQVQQHLGKNRFTGELFVFRGRRGDLIKILCWDGQGLCLFSKRLEKGRFVWPQAKDEALSLTAAQRRCCSKEFDWRMPARTWQPEMAS